MTLKKSDIIVFVIILAAIVGLAALFFIAPSAPADLGYAPVEIPGSTLAVTPGASWEGMELFTVNLVQDGFITVHQSMGGAPGPIIGTSGFLDHGLHDGTGVKLDTPLVPGQSYIALLHVDNGDQVFTVADDLPVSADGQVVRVDFQADPNLPAAVN